MSSTSDAPIQTVENTLVTGDQMIAIEKKREQTVNIMCHVHPAIMAADRCYTCHQLVCVACKEYQTGEYWVKGGSVFVPFTTCVSCLARNSSWKGLEDSTRNRVVNNLSGCSIQ